MKERLDPQTRRFMNNSDSEFAGAVEELAARVLNGDAADTEEILQRFPQFEPQLRDMLSTLAALAEWKGSDSPPIAPARDETVLLPLDRQLGDFRIVRELGRGGMGIVYEAEQISLQRRVALKVLPFASLISERQLRRFKNEALAAASLRHPNIVGVYGTGCERSVHFYAMELIDGCDLSQVIQRLQERSDEKATDGDQMMAAGDRTTAVVAQLSTKRDSSRTEFYRSVATLGEQAARALHFAHEEGVVHRDIKPANLLMDNQGKVHVADFGLARIRLDGELTLSGDIVGTLRYMSPEQVESRVVDHRTDIYSLGATLYEMVTAKSLFHDEQNRATLVAKITEANPSHVKHHDASIPNDLATVIHKCLRYSADERYATAKELAEELQRFLDQRPIRAKRTGVVSKAYRWAKRNRTLSSVSLVALASVVVLAIAGPFAAVRVQQALDKEKQLSSQLANSNSQLELHLYDMRVRTALKALEQADAGPAKDVLKAYDSPASADTDLRNFEYWLLKAKFDRCQQALLATSGIDIQELALSPDGNLIACGDWLGNIRVVNRTTSAHNRIGKLGDGLEKSIAHLCEFSSDGNYLLVAGGTDIKIWDVPESRWIPLGRGSDSQNRYILGGSFIEGGDESRLLIVDQDRPYSQDNKSRAALSLYTVDLKSESPQLELVARLETDTVDRCSISNTVAVAASLGAKEIRKWAIPSLKPLESVKVSTDHLERVEVHPKQDDLLAVAFSEDRPGHRQSRVELISVSDPNVNQVLATHTTGIGCLEFSADGTTLLAGFHDGQAWSWRDVDKGGEVSVVEQWQVHTSAIQDVVFVPATSRLYSAGSDYTVRETRLDESSLVESLPVMGHTSAIKWSNNDQQLILAGIDRLSIWDVERKMQVRARSLSLAADRVNYAGDLCWLADGQRIAFVANAWPASGHSRVGVWDILTNETQWLYESERQANEVKLTPDGKVLVATVGAQLLAFSSDDLQLEHEQVFSPRCSVAIHPHKNLAAVSGPGENRETVQEIVLWDIDRWIQIDKIPAPDPFGIEAITFSPDGERLAADIGNDRIAIWRIRQQRQPPLVISAQADIAKLSFTPDGKRIASAGWDGKIRLWNCDTGNEITQFDTAGHWAFAVAFNHDGTSLAFGGGLGTKYGTVHLLHAPR